MNPPLFYLYGSAENPYEFCRESPENPWRINAEISPWILVSLTTQISPGIPLHQGSTIPRDSLQNLRDFARWDNTHSR